EAYNAKDLEGLRDLYHHDATYWSALTDLCDGRDAILTHVQELFAALPDEQMRAKVVVVEGETAVAEFESFGCDADGVEYRIEFTEVFKLADGLIDSVTVYIDPETVENIASNH
ncbi:MAG: nuclear transport factor 2 family protein, partial [Acidimicrobiales bacterium]|nr:nuclear transport factor 2 family protein [Acidimicrobiales bacterium]